MDNRVTMGASPAFLLFLVFLVLKLTGHIAWSWWWVTAPLWGPAVIVLAFIVGGFILFLILVLISAAQGKNPFQ